MGSKGLIPTTDRFGTALGEIARCQRCGHMQVDPMPAESVLTHAYRRAASEEYVDEQAGQRETARHTLERIERYASPPGALLDVGCWVGFLLAEARTRGWRTAGIEPSEFASGYARTRFGLDVLTSDLFSASLPTASFDVVTMGDVIEHFVAPGAAMLRVAELLAPGGIVWLAMPDAGSRVARALGRRWWSVLPTHVQYFTRHSIAILLEQHGFELLDTTSAPKAFTVGYYLERVGGYSRTLAGVLGAAGRISGVADRMWAPDFRDRIAVIARRTG